MKSLTHAPLRLSAFLGGLALAISLFWSQSASASTWTETIRYDALCGTNNFSVCGVSRSQFYGPDEPYVVRMTFHTPTSISGDGRLDLRFFGDFDHPGEFLDVVFEPPSFIDASVLQNDFRSDLPDYVWPRDRPRRASCKTCSFEVDGKTYKFSRLANEYAGDDVFIHDTIVTTSRGDHVIDEGSQWRDVMAPYAILEKTLLSEWLADGKFELAFVFSSAVTGGHGVHGNPFTDATFNLNFYTQEELDAMTFNWLEATLTLDAAPSVSAVTAVPIPASALLLVSGFAGLALLRGAKRRPRMPGEAGRYPPRMARPG